MATTTVPSEPRWLTDAEQRTWRAFRESARLLFAQLDRDLSRDAGMAAGTYATLVVLSEAPRRTLRMNELAEATMSSPSRMSHAVERLVELGWVERTTCPSDRRGWLATLTDSGFGALAAAAPRHVEHLRTYLFSGLSETDVAELGRITESVLSRLPASAAPSGGCIE
ncbi:MAG: MarR family transcriptional regulator [Candidatus Dormibacteraeota bacterium]|nr:MarR family transcriptional regulator [Candidatus Dormibacteraeota bacterium]